MARICPATVARYTLLCILPATTRQEMRVGVFLSPPYLIYHSSVNNTHNSNPVPILSYQLYCSTIQP